MNTKFKLFLARLFGINLGFTAGDLATAGAEQFDLGHKAGVVDGRKQAVTRFAVLPLPFTEEQLRGALYGASISAQGTFAVVFGEEAIPACGPHGYEQRGYYVSRQALNNSPNDTDLHCHNKNKFADPANAEDLVPVIVTVLR